MNLTDPVADFLTRIRNSIRARHQKLDVPASKLKAEIARILKEEGYISNYKTQEEEGKLVLRVYLKYGGTEAAIRDLARISRPGCRVYIAHKSIEGLPAGNVRRRTRIGGLLPEQEPRPERELVTQRAVGCVDQPGRPVQTKVHQRRRDKRQANIQPQE